VVGIAGDGRVEVVLDHAVWRFDQPVFAGQLGPPRWVDYSLRHLYHPGK
jgi:hypothetical protein